MDLVRGGLQGFFRKVPKTQINGDAWHAAHQNPRYFTLRFPVRMATETTDDLAVAFKSLFQQFNFFTGIELPRVFRLPYFERRVVHQNGGGLGWIFCQ